MLSEIITAVAVVAVAGFTWDFGRRWVAAWHARRADTSRVDLIEASLRTRMDALERSSRIRVDEIEADVRHRAGLTDDALQRLESTVKSARDEVQQALEKAQQQANETKTALENTVKVGFTTAKREIDEIIRQNTRAA